MTLTEQIKRALEDTASRVGLAPSTVGERIGQGGQFYKRMCEGKRIWPETAQDVFARLEQLSSPSADAPSSEGARPEDFLPNEKRGGANPDVQGSGIHDLDGNAA